MNLSDQKKGILLAFFGILAISPDSLFIRLVNIKSWDLVFYRGFIPFLILFIFLLIYYKKSFLSKIYIIGYAGLLNAIIVALTNITFIVSIENTNVANTLVMLSIAPFFAAFMSMIFLKEYPKKRTWVAIFLCFLAVFYIFYDSFQSGRLYGDFFALITSFLVGASSVVIRYKKIVNFIPSLMLAKFFTMLFVIFFVQSLYLEGNDIYLIPVMCVFLVTLPLVLITLAPRFIPAHEVELFFVLETTLGPIWVWLVIKEAPSLETIIGGAIIISILFIHTILDFNDKKIKAPLI